MTVFLIYKTDQHHSKASRELIGVVQKEVHVLDICKQEAEREHAELDDSQIFYLKQIRQTHGYKGAGEFDYEEVETGVLL